MDILDWFLIGCIVVGVVGLALERWDSSRPQEDVRVTRTRTGSAVEAHYHVHERGQRHICIRVKEPDSFDQRLALKRLEQDHADDPRVDLSCVRRPEGRGSGSPSGGGGG